MKQAMRDKDAVSLTTIRGILSAIMNESINLGRGPQGELTSEEIVGLMRREAKRVKDAINQFIEGGREDLADDNKAELAVLERFLPALMSVDAIRPIAEAKKAELGTTAADKGKLIGVLAKELAGQADGGDIKSVVDSLFV